MVNYKKILCARIIIFFMMIMLVGATNYSYAQIRPRKSEIPKPTIENYKNITKDVKKVTKRASSENTIKTPSGKPAGTVRSHNTTTVKSQSHNPPPQIKDSRTIFEEVKSKVNKHINNQEKNRQRLKAIIQNSNGLQSDSEQVYTIPLDTIENWLPNADTLKISLLADVRNTIHRIQNRENISQEQKYVIDSLYHYLNREDVIISISSKGLELFSIRGQGLLPIDQIRAVIIPLADEAYSLFSDGDRDIQELIGQLSILLEMNNY